MEKIQSLLNQIQEGTWSKLGEGGIHSLCDEYIEQYLQLSPEERAKADAMRAQTLEHSSKRANKNLDELIATRVHVRGVVQELKEKEAARKAAPVAPIGEGVPAGR